MAASTFDDALRRLLIHEGGYTNHPSDPGGPTKFGITIVDYRRYVKAGATAADVRAMTLGEAETIYRERYWNAMRCDELPAGVDYAVFDYAVNSGISRAAKVLQRLLGFADNGRIGDALLAAVRKRDAADLIARLCDERLAFLQRLKTWPVFGAGWGRRVKEVRAAALAMAKAKTVSD
jgi:lysozyme family protein